MTTKYRELALKSFNSGCIDDNDIRWILTDNSIELLPLLQAAFEVRQKYFGKKVKIQIINNVQSGNCSEDCRYCAQSGSAENPLETYPMKSAPEIFQGANNAYTNGAYRYCMVFSGRDADSSRIDKIVDVVREIKKHYPLELCVSAGFLSLRDAQKLRNAGVDRYNHNLNTSKGHYGNICTSHEYQKRLETLQTAQKAGLAICSGIIIGLGESVEDIIAITKELRNLNAQSVPINFFIPIKGHRIEHPQQLTPLYCLKMLAVFRLCLPKVEIRAAGGREYHLRSMQSLCFYAVNSVFSRGYLTIGGESVDETKQMIIDSGFEIEAIEQE